jgi:hypothetical protein
VALIEQLTDVVGHMQVAVCSVVGPITEQSSPL